MTEPPSIPDAMSHARFGPFRLGHGVQPRHAAMLMLASFSTIGFVTFLSFMSTPLVNLLQVPSERQGVLLGLLVSLQEVVQIVVGGLIGAWSDRIGRRPLFVGGLVVMAIGYVVYPLAPSESWLFVLRGVYAVGMAAAVVMLTTCVAEYIHESSRGRWMGSIGVCNGLGVVVMALGLTRLPLLFSRFGLDDAAALRASFWTFAVAIMLLALMVHRGLRAPVDRPSRRVALLRQTIRGLTVARDNPRIALAYLTAFASRGDLVIVTTFVSLWRAAGGHGRRDVGRRRNRARRHGLRHLPAGRPRVAAGDGLRPPSTGVPRLLGVCAAFGLAAAGYLLLGVVDDPLGRGMLAAVILTGIGEASAIVSAGVLIGQEAPAELRGAVFGSYSFSGSLGQICPTAVGGLVFDRIGPHAPFVMMGMVNGVVMVAAFFVYRWSVAVPRLGPGAAAPAMAVPRDKR